MNLEELKAYVKSLREKFFAEKHKWHGESVLVENTYIKGIERAVELMEKGLNPKPAPNPETCFHCNQEIRYVGRGYWAGVEDNDWHCPGETPRRTVHSPVLQKAVKAVTDE